MFTGIVQGVGKIINIINSNNDFKTLKILFPDELLDNIEVLYSVSINGVCLSITNINKNEISFDVIDETLKLTNLKKLKINDIINIERSAKLNEEVGGHFLSGHIIDVGLINKINRTDNNCQMEIKLTNKNLMRYIFYKGYIGIDGISITIGNVFDNYFNVHLIPDTMMKTTMQYRNVGDEVNIEIDTQTQIIVNTVERVLKEHYRNMPSCFCNEQNDEEENTTEEQNNRHDTINSTDTVFEEEYINEGYERVDAEDIFRDIEEDVRDLLRK